MFSKHLGPAPPPASPHPNTIQKYYVENGLIHQMFKFSEILINRLWYIQEYDKFLLWII